MMKGNQQLAIISLLEQANVRLERVGPTLCFSSPKGMSRVGGIHEELSDLRRYYQDLEDECIAIRNRASSTQGS